MFITILAALAALVLIVALTFAAYLTAHLVRYRRHRARMDAIKTEQIRKAFRRDRDAAFARRNAI